MALVKLVFVFLFSFGIFLVSLKSVDPQCEGVDPNTIISFPHENNCSLYYECSGGVQILESCPTGLWYNNKTHSCDFPSLSGCTYQNPMCIDVDIDYFPDPEDCTKYIECYHGNSYEMRCPDGFLYHVAKKMCVPYDESDCVVSTTPPWTTPHAVCWGVRPNQTVLRPFDGDCGKYWECTGSQNILRDCPPKLFFDEERQMCDLPELVNCQGSTISPDPSSTTALPTTPDDEIDPRCVNQSLIYLPHPASCERYIECYRGQSYDMSCPSGLYFNEELLQCVNPSQSECGKTTSTSSPSNGTTATPGTTTERPTGWTVDPDCGAPENFGKLLPYPGDCTKYYACVNGEKVAMNCPGGLYFSESYGECVYPYQSDCTQSFFDYLSALIYGAN